MKLGDKSRCQSFFLHVPGAHRVQLAGDFTNWLEHPIDLHKQADGLWHVTLTLPASAQYYHFLVDGQWQEDPEACTRGDRPPAGFPFPAPHDEPSCANSGCLT
jgi:1,4-alpha-glucan branching enzyme